MGGICVFCCVNYLDEYLWATQTEQKSILTEGGGEKNEREGGKVRGNLPKFWDLKFEIKLQNERDFPVFGKLNFRDQLDYSEFIGWIFIYTIIEEHMTQNQYQLKFSSE